MKKYRKKPVIIEAEQWFGRNDVPEANITMPYSAVDKCPFCGKMMIYHGMIKSLERNYIICPGDWIIKDIKGEFYPVKPDIFENTYEPIE